MKWLQDGMRKRNMNSYYETFLRKEIYPDQDDKIDVICEVWERHPSERRYIEMVIDDYISGGSRYQAIKRLERNIIGVFQHMQKKGNYLDEEYLSKMY